ncbi:MAG TPA: ParB/RepB/Spo0J family partition protein, partial [Solirubrobacteraceae bacterium]|nr:ParB/RepB/Spo0J family partition protein [Solirubrobacteraceae bacterium]
MNVRRGGLGRGLGALIPTGPAEEQIEGARFEEIPLESIEPNPRQPREVFDPEALGELVTSIREVGILQPIVVRELDPGRYQLIMGERRWRASREAGLEAVPAIIRDTADDALLRDALLENLHRQELNALEEAAAYAQLLEEFGATHEELADRVGRSRSHVTNTLRLLHLTPSVQRRIAAGVLSAGHARALLALDDGEAQERLASRVVAEGLSVRAVEEIVAVGTQDRPAPAPRTRKAIAPAVAVLADRLSERLDTRVTVELGKRRGKVVIQFGSVDDLERIAGLLGVTATGESDGGSNGSDGQQQDGPWHEDGHHADQHHADQHHGEHGHDH